MAKKKEQIVWKRTNSNLAEGWNRQPGEPIYGESDRDRNARMRAIEMARANRTRDPFSDMQYAYDVRENGLANYAQNSNANAGNNRTTETVNRNRNITNTVSQPQSYGTANAGNNRTTAVSSNYMSFQPASTKNQTSYGVNAQNINSTEEAKAYYKAERDKNSITEEQSLAHAKEVINPYINDKDLNSLFNQYAQMQELKEYGTNSAIDIFGISANNFSNQMRPIKEDIQKRTGLSDEEFEKIIENYRYYRNYQGTQNINEAVSDLNPVAKGALWVGNRVASVPSNVMAGLGAIQNNTKDPELGRDWNRPMFVFSNINEATNEAVHKDIDENIDNGTANFIVSHAYDLATMSGDSFAAAIAGPVGLASYGTGSYANNLREAENRGLPESQAQAYAIIMGATEIATEKIPFDNLTDLLKHGAAKEEVKGLLSPTVKAITKQFLEEGGEEVANDIVDDIADGLINGDQSKNNIRLQYYMSDEYAKENNNGVRLTEDEALALVVKERALEYLQDGVMGGLSGAGAAGAAIVTNKATTGIDNAISGQNLVKNENLVNEVLYNPQHPDYISTELDDYDTEEDYEQAQQAREQLLNASKNAVIKNQKPKLRESAKVYTDAVKALELRNDNRNIPEEYRNRKTSESETLDALDYASDPYRLALAAESVSRMTPAIQERYAEKVEQLKDYNFTQDQIDNAITVQKAYKLGLEQTKVTDEDLKSIPEAYREKVKLANQEAYNKKFIEAHPNAVIDTNTGEAIIPQSVEIKDNSLVVVDQEGNEHTEYYNPLTSAVDKYADKYNMSPAQEKIALEFALASSNSKSADFNYSLNQIRNAASLGTKGWNDFLKANTFVSKLIENNRIDSKKAQELYESFYDATKSADTQKAKSATVKNEGKVTDAVKEMLESENKAFAELVKAYAKKTGTNIVAINYNNDTRAAYIPEKGEIALNKANAHQLWISFIHEAVGEKLQRYANAEDIRDIQNDILNYLEETLGESDYNRLIDSYQFAYRQSDSKVDQNKTRREAANEMANDFMAGLFSSEKGLSEFVDWVTDAKTANQQVTILQKIKDMFDSFLKYIKDFFANGKFNAAETAALNMAENRAEALRQKIIKALDKAIENRDAQVGQQGKSAPRNSIKISYENQIDELVANTFNPNSYLVLRENLPEAFVKFAGLIDAPVVMNYRKAKISMDESGEYSDHYHNLGPEIMKQIPKAMEDPEMILRLPNGRINAILKIVDKKGRTILISLEMDKGKYIDKKYAKFKNPEQAVLVTAFGAKPKYIEKLIDEGKILYPKEKASSDVHEGSQRANPSIKDAILNNSVAPKAEKSTDNLSKNSEKSVDNARSSKVVAGYEVDDDLNVQAHAEDLNAEEQTKTLAVQQNKLVLRNPKYMQNTTWSKIAKEFKKLGYTDITNGNVAKQTFTRLIENNPYGYYIFNDDQAEAIAKIFGLNTQAEQQKETISPEEASNIAKKAEKKFGTTNNFDLAGYLDVNGKLLDFSDGQGYRVQDHRGISEVLNLPEDADYSDGLIEFMAEGNIRLQSYGIDIAAKPNEVQRKKLREFFNHLDGEVTVDFSNINGDSIGSAEYVQGTASSRILNDIDSYFDGGDVPEGNYNGINEFRYSKQIDFEYEKALKENDISEMQQLVEQAARAAGFDSPLLYHGTSKFGFTSFDLDKMDDKQTIFLTSNNNIAATYSGTTQNKAVSEKFGDINAIPNDKLADALNSVIPDDGTGRHYEYFNQDDIKALREKALTGIKDVFSSLDELLKTTKEEKALKTVKRMREIQLLSSAEDILNKESVNKDFSTMLFMATHHTETFKDNNNWKELEQAIRKAYALTNEVSKSETEFIVDNYLDGYLFDVWTPKEARVDLKENVSKGNYSLYAKLGNSLVIDAKNQNWNNIRGWIYSYTDYLNLENTKVEIMDDMAILYTENGVVLFKKQIDTNNPSLTKKDIQKNLLSLYKMSANFMHESLNTTRDIVKFAKTRGFDSVVFKNIKDNGGRNLKISYDEIADIYALFNPNNVKSADPVTYDDNGNVIPPSQRFNTEEKDFRFSIKVDDDRVLYHRGTEIIQNPTSKEYEQMEADILKDRPWLKGEPLLRHTYDEQGNEYYWDAYAGLHSQIEPAIAKHWNTRVNQQWKWYEDQNKDFWANRSWRNSITVYGDASPYADSINQTKIVEEVLSTINNNLKGTSVSMKFLDKTVDEIIKKYQADVDADELKMELSQFIAHMTADESVNYDQMMNYLLNVGDKIIKSSTIMDEEEQRIYDETKSFLKGYSFKLSKEEIAELKYHFGDWNTAFGVLNQAGINLDATNGTAIDRVFSELQQGFLETSGINLEKYNKPSDQIIGLIDVMSALEPRHNAFEGANALDNALDVAVTIIDSYYAMADYTKELSIINKTEKGKQRIQKALSKETAKVRENLRSQFNKYKETKEEAFKQLVLEKNQIIQQQQNQLRAQEAQMKKWDEAAKDQVKQQKLTAEQMKRTAKIQALEAVQSYKEAQERAKQIENIRKSGIRMIKWLAEPTEKQHIPNFLQKPLGEFLAAIDFLPKNAKADSKSTLSWQQRMQTLRDTLIKVREAEIEGEDSPEAYFAQSIVTKDLLAMMDDFLGKETWDEFTQSYVTTKRAAKKVSLLEAKELQTLNKIMSGLSAAINNMNKTYANEFYKEVDELARVSYEELNELKKDKVKYNRYLKSLGEFFIKEKTPVYFFDELGKGAKSVFDELQQGWNLRTNHIREASEHIAEFKKANNITDKEMSKWSSHVNEFKLSEGTIELTDAQIMSLYRIVNRKQGRPHVMLGGIRPADTVIGRNTTHYNKAVHINAGDYQKIISVLSEDQIKMADEMQKYMATECAKWGNRVAQKMFGYKKFEESDYFPLKTDAHSRAVTNVSDNNVGYNTIKNSSFTKNIVPNANNAVMLEDIFDVFTGHVEQMANYDGFVMPIADAMRWFNYSEKVVNATEEGLRVDVVSNMQEAIEGVLGTAGTKYFRTFIKNINGMYEGTGGSIGLADNLASGYKAQAVMANLRVVVQQPMAIARAADRIEDKYLIQALTPHIGESYAKKAQKNSALAFWKAQGYYETMIGQSMKSIITGEQSLKDKVNAIGGWAAGKADDITWGVIYRASELKVSKEHPELAYDSEEYTKEVVKQFEEIINYTQVVDTIFHKSEYMRSKNAVTKMLTAFMAEPTLTLNMTAHRLREAGIESSNGNKAAAIKTVAKLMRVLIANDLLLAFAQSLLDALRDDDPEKDLSEKMLKYMFGLSDDMSVKEVLTSNVVDNINPLNWIPVAKEFMSYVQGYDASNMYVDAIYSAGDTITELAKLATGQSNKTTYGAIYTTAKGVSQLTGMPISNAIREIRTLHNNINDLWGGSDWYTSQRMADKAEKAAAQKEFSKAFEGNNQRTITNAMKDIYNNNIEAGKNESESWSAVRDALKTEFLSQVQQGDESLVTVQNRFRTLLKKTMYSNGSRPMSEKEVENTIRNWTEAAGK